ncbi:unannotated protein [freshwater metagenome]|uniref:Unannotated protein n=1 Tax=freshwater metagenome TaxID=449393 RepID=A0A6J7GJ88_9ZZZZ
MHLCTDAVAGVLLKNSVAHLARFLRSDDGTLDGMTNIGNMSANARSTDTGPQ